MNRERHEGDEGRENTVTMTDSHIKGDMLTEPISCDSHFSRLSRFKTYKRGNP